MDFNRAFTDYDTIEGGLCKTSEKKISQKEAAIEAVKAVGLNQISKVRESWFKNKEDYRMFVQRLEVLK